MKVYFILDEGFFVEFLRGGRDGRDGFVVEVYAYDNNFFWFNYFLKGLYFYIIILLYIF